MPCMRFFEVFKLMQVFVFKREDLVLNCFPKAVTFCIISFEEYCSNIVRKDIYSSFVVWS